MEYVMQITSREFRSNQKKFFDLADKGVQIVLRRGKKQAYTLVPVNDGDFYLSPELKAKLDKSIQEAKEGKVKRVDDIEELDKMLGL